MTLSTLQILMLGAPGIALLFASGFLFAWHTSRSERHLLHLAGSYALFAGGMSMQILAVPGDLSLNAMLSVTLYTLSALLLADGALRRAGRHLPLPLAILMLAGMVGATYVLCYVTPDLTRRVRLHNFGFFILFLLTALQLHPASRRRRIDRAVFWVFLAFALGFIPRMLLALKPLSPLPDQYGHSPFWLTLQMSLLIFSVLLALTLLTAMMLDRIELLSRERDQDVLTRLLNRRGFDSQATHRLRDPGFHPVCVIICDIDHFKRVNDAFGHAAGDAVLETFGTLVRHRLRPDDAAGRIGGEEFAILLANTDLDGGLGFAERLRAEFAQSTFPLVPASRQITASFGVVTCHPYETLADSLARADSLLYAAKHAGRNRTVLQPA
ncbi:GGDEF domain-containing protein [Microvirgula curvata]